MRLNNSVYETLGAELGQLKDEYNVLKSAFERRDDFIIWLSEVKLGDYSLNELWDEFEKFEEDYPQ